MNRETFRLSQKELQRVAVISFCIKGDLASFRKALEAQPDFPEAAGWSRLGADVHA